MMRIMLNGQEREVATIQLDAILKECNYHSENIATAVNGIFIHRHQRADTQICEHDQIEVVAPIEGG